MARLIDLPEMIVRDVAELPDRTSPDDQPEMMLVTRGELDGIVTGRVADVDDELARLRAGLSALVNCRSPLTRAQMREAAAEVLAGKTTPMQDQSPFVETNARLRAENENHAQRIDAMHAIWRTHKCNVDGRRSVGECVDGEMCGCSCALFIPREPVTNGQSTKGE